MFQHFHFQKKLFFITAALFLITILLIFLGFSYYIVRDSQIKSKEYFINMAEKGRQRIEQFVDNMQSVSMQIVANNTIQNTYLEALESKKLSIKYFDMYPEEKRKIRKECAAINNITNSIQKIYIYSKPNAFFSYNSYSLNYNYIQKALDQTNINQLNWDNKVYYQLVGPHKDTWAEDSTMVISLLRPLITTYSTHEQIAMIEIENLYSKLEEACNNSEYENSKFILIDRNTQSVVYPYHSMDKLTEQYYVDVCNSNKAGISIKKDKEGNKQLLYTADISDSSWKLVVALPYSTYTSSLKNIILLLVLCFFICLIVVNLGIYLTTIKLSLPIIELRESLNEISIEKTAISLEFHSNNEIEQLKEKFNDVLQALADSVKKLNISKTAEYEAKIQSLQAQINPHFLFNSLMAISAAGQESENMKVQNMCAQLSSLFRYSYSKEAVSTIGNEIINITTYLEFMKFRYLDELNYDIIDCPDLKDTLIPKLSLQPLIENCFTHGFRSVRPPLYINVTCKIEENGWCIYVKDNGGGFSESILNQLTEQIERINNDFRENVYGLSVDTNNQALLNVYIRLKARYGDSAMMSIENIRTGGAVIRIKGGLNEGL